MACPINLRTDGLVGASTGGTWTFNGYHVSSPSGPFGGGGTSPGTLTGDNPAVDFSGFTPGYYSFNYAGGSGECAAEVDLVVVVLASVDAGCDATYPICEGQGGANVSLLTIKNAECSESITDDGLVITVQSGDPDTAFDSGAGTIDLEDLPIGTYVFLFTKSVEVPGGYTLADCEDCDPDTATLTITVAAAFNPGDPNSIGLCG